MKKIIYLTISLFSLFTITVCQKTPESPIVRGKDIDNIIEKADVPITYTNDDGLTTVHEEYHRPWMYEKIRITS